MIVLWQMTVYVNEFNVKGRKLILAVKTEN